MTNCKCLEIVRLNLRFGRFSHDNISGITQCCKERTDADEDIIEAVQKYTQTLQKSLEAAEMLKSFADNISKDLWE